MSKRPVKALSKPVKLHFHEMNLQRLCLISIQRQIDKQKDHSWKIVHETEGDEPYTVMRQKRLQADKRILPSSAATCSGV
ncbi:hypothetical protein DC3_57710 [Deinococcus cellulosilyticus NBRC 106333 = KACC 11606]|uniref:Uncharacterized protein n=1 Tax=Deinococcus cellulosilyticus (strain DSM 18568 / NBRC 106333 / KACC 11606 / 5516J-15) TaxID=1223518 RepID=A0A511NC41_DEIC1|nr:hypothetical protein DC3_57710 [Deinococcus cellulosilyticus NBRC 106333 = KACC 11606]